MTQAEIRHQLIVRERQTNRIQGLVMAPAIIFAPIAAIYVIGIIFG